MSVTLTFGAWWIPLLITIVAVGWAIFWVDDGGGWLSGLGNILALIPALFVSMVAWIVWGVVK